MRFTGALISTLFFAAGLGFGQYTPDWSSGNLGSGGYGGAYGYDIDGDGLVEFYIRSANQLIFYNGDYSIAWNISFPGFYYVSVIQPRDVNGDGLVVPLNLDNDGTGEIVIVGYYYDSNLSNYFGRFRVYNGSTHALEYESPTITGFYGTASLEDIDNDGRDEIILNRFGSSTSSSYVDVYVYSGSGSEENSRYQIKQHFQIEPTISSRSFDIAFYIHPWQLDMPVTIIVNDQSGRQIRVINIERPVKSGLNHAQWNCLDDNGKAVPTGTYFARVVIGSNQESKKVMVVR